MAAGLGADVPLLAVPAAAMAELTGVHFHRGVLAVGRAARAAPGGRSRRRGPHGLVLEGVNDHENIGALFRNAAAFGVDAVVLDPTTADPLYRHATGCRSGTCCGSRSPGPSAGRGCSTGLGAAGFTTVALTPEPATPSRSGASSTTPPGPGRARWSVPRGRGSRDAAMAAVDRRVRIPMAPASTR